MTKPVILTGIRANQDLTIGNYFGAILPIIDMAKKRSEEFQINMFIPDLHSFTTPIDHSKLKKQIMDNAKLFAAAGLPLDNPNIFMYRQSYIPAHSELTVILDSFTGFGEMNRMTQFKEKSIINADERRKVMNLLSETVNEAVKEGVGVPNTPIKTINKYYSLAIKQFEELKSSNVSVGLFNYPVLMAADILLYNAQYIPVGDDQTQHLEFTRDIAQRMNKKFGDMFTVPESVPKQHEFFGNDQGLRIKDLIDPTKKMSKSDESGRGVIFLNDEPAAAAKKIMGATTDDKAEINFDRENQPGISNLLEILALLRGIHLDEVINEFKGQTRYGDFKAVVAKEIEQFLTDFQQKLATVDENAVIAKLEQSERDVAPVANATLLRAQQAVGLR
jgi:tryptophanyl-tRNA synthetase